MWQQITQPVLVLVTEFRFFFFLVYVNNDKSGSQGLQMAYLHFYLHTNSDIIGKKVFLIDFIFNYRM